MKKHLKSVFALLIIFACSLTNSQASKLYDVIVIDKDYILLHFQDGDALYVDDGIGIGALREYNFDDLSNNFTVTFGDPLNTSNATNPANWVIKSSADSNYGTSGQTVAAAWRKTKINGTEEVQFVGSDWTYEFTNEHFIILRLPSSMVQGASYTLEINPNTESDTEVVDFSFDFLTTKSAAVHVNTIGYSNSNSIKAADLYMWLGNSGARDYSSFVGNKVYLVNVVDEQATEVGAVSFWRNSNAEVINFDLIQSPVWNVDFTGFNTPGTYRLAVEGVGCSDEFEIKQDIYFEPFKVSTQGFYYMRIGEEANANTGNSLCVPRQPQFIPDQDPTGFKVVLTTLNPFDPEWGDNWDNPDYFASFAQPGSPENPNAIGGHSDARDWDRHLNHATIIWDLLLPYILTDGTLSDDDLGIAESGNGIPDILDEARNEVDFFLSIRDQDGGYSWGLSNPQGGIGSNSIIYQAGSNAFSAWTNAVNCAIMAQAFRIQGNTTLENFYRDEAITAYNFANNAADPMLDNVWNFGLAYLKGRDLKMTAAAYLYNLTGNSTYEQVVNAESVVQGNSNQDVIGLEQYDQLWGSVGYLVANRPYNGRSITYSNVYNNMKSSIISNAQQKEVSEIGIRASRRATYRPYSFYQTVHHVYRTLVAHAISTDTQEKAEFLDALTLEADWGLGRNPLNIIQMTTSSTILQLNKGVENIYTTGSDDGAPGVHPGHTPYAELRDFPGSSTGSKASVLLSSCFPSSSDWPAAELFFSTQHIFAHSEFTPQQTMRGKQALYSYLYALSGGQTPAPSSRKLTVENGSGTGFYPAGSSQSIAADSPPPGHEFQAWIGNSIYVDDYYIADPTNPNTTVSIPEGNIQIKATYRKIPPPRYTLNVGNGTVNGVSTVTGDFEAGERILVMANNPNPGSRFDQWQGAVNTIVYPSSAAINSAAIEIIMPANNISLTASYVNGTPNYPNCGVLQNPGFEDALFVWGASSNTTLSKDARSGNWSARGLGNQVGAIFFNDIDVTGNNSFEFRIWVKSEGDTNGSSIGIDYFDANGNEVDEDFVNINTPDWEEKIISGTIPSNVTRISIWTWVAQGNILYDDACLTLDGNTSTNFSLTVNANNGSVALNPPGGSYPDGTVVTLTAVPNGGFTFDSWSGDLTGNTNPIQLTMDGNKTVNANFIPDGNSSSNDFIIRAKGDTGEETMELRVNDAVVATWILSTTFDNYTYSGYSGTNNIKVAQVNDGLSSNGVDKNMIVDYIEVGGTVYNTSTSAQLGGGCGDLNTEYLWCNAYFDFGPINGGSSTQTYTLNISATNGNVSPNPAGSTYAAGTVVTLTPIPDNGFEFDSWSGDLIGNANPIQITMDGNKNVTANFVSAPTYTLNISATNGSVTLNPTGGIYLEGTIVTLIPSADTGFEFDSWSGDLSGNANPTQVTMDGNKNIAANFIPQPSGGTDLIIRAKGDTGEETMELRINDATVASWAVNSTNWAEYTYSDYAGTNNIKVVHTNDGLSSQGVDKNIQVDYIQAGNTVYETNTTATLEGGCGDLNSEYLWCNNALFNYGAISDGVSSLIATGNFRANNSFLNWRIFPNPLVQNNLTLYLEKIAGPTTIEIFDLKGRKVYQDRLNSEYITIIPNLNAGTYKIFLKNQTQIWTETLIVTNN